MLQAHQQQRKAASSSSKGTAPRFERLMARLDLSDKEQLAMLYVLVKQVSQEDLSNLVPKFGRSSPSFAAFAKLVSISQHQRGMPSCIANLNSLSRRSPLDLFQHDERILSSDFVSVVTQDEDCMVCSVSHLHHNAICGALLLPYPVAWHHGKSLHISNQFATSHCLTTLLPGTHTMLNPVQHPLAA